MNDSLTLGQFLLGKFAGALLPVPENTPILPGTIGELANQSDNYLCDITRFRLREPISINQICDTLREYYDSINWIHTIEVCTDLTSIVGDVWPEDAETVLSVFAAYEDEVLTVSLNPTIA